MEKKSLDVKVFFSPIFKREPFRGKVEAISSQNKLGRFDILPGHINFITLIFNNLTVHTFSKKTLTYQFEKGVLQVSEDKANIFLGL